MRWRRVALEVVQCALVWTCTVSHAAAEEPAEPDPVAIALEEARVLHGEGVARYNTFDYEGAVEAWTQAYSKLPVVDATAQVRSDLVYNIARALQRLYEQDDQVKHLKRARQLFERYIDEKLDSGVDESAPDIVDAREKLAQLQQAIDDATPEVAPPPTPVTKSAPPEAEPHRGRGLIISGAVLTSVGVAVVASTLASGLVIGSRAQSQVPELDALADEAAREDAIQRGRLGNQLALGGSIAGGVVAIVGVALLGTGVGQRRKADRLALLPIAAPGCHGLAFSGGF